MRRTMKRRKTRRRTTTKRTKTTRGRTAMTSFPLLLLSHCCHGGMESR
jgi:hypothetical protein